MPSEKFQKNRPFFITLIAIVLLILWTSRTDLKPKKVDFTSGDKKADGGFDMGGLGGGHSEPDAAAAPSSPEPARILRPPVPPPRPAWMDDPNQPHYDLNDAAPEVEQSTSQDTGSQQQEGNWQLQQPQQPDSQNAVVQAQEEARQAWEKYQQEAAKAWEEYYQNGGTQGQQAPEQFNPNNQPQWYQNGNAQSQSSSSSTTDQYVSSSTTSAYHSSATQHASGQALGYQNPQFDKHKLKRFKPHNYQGPGHHTYATYLSTRGGSLQDPYFLAAQQLVYRLLWDPRSKSVNHPITVFVAPHIEDEQRELLTAAGAIVRELDYVEDHVAESEATKWKDLFSKINMWGQTDYTRITFLDLDAFPVKNIDGIFEIAQKRQCRREMLAFENPATLAQYCEFVFTGTDISGSQEVNAGMMVLEPNVAMHQYLLRESKKTENFDSSIAEQPFINFAFRQNGPFPAQFVDRSWNGVRPQESEMTTLKVMHARLWEIDPRANGALSWAGNMFAQNWAEMLSLYHSQEFLSIRAADGARTY